MKLAAAGESSQQETIYYPVIIKLNILFGIMRLFLLLLTSLFYRWQYFENIYQMSAYGKNTDRYFHRQYLRLECLCAHIPNHVATGHMKILHGHLQARKKNNRNIWTWKWKSYMYQTMKTQHKRSFFPPGNKSPCQAELKLICTTEKDYVDTPLARIIQSGCNSNAISE